MVLSCSQKQEAPRKRGFLLERVWRGEIDKATASPEGCPLHPTAHVLAGFLRNTQTAGTMKEK
jgi:hypothetical protein